MDATASCCGKALRWGRAAARHAPGSSVPAYVPRNDVGRTQGPMLRRRLAALTYCGCREHGEPKSSLVKAATHTGTGAWRPAGPARLRGAIGRGFTSELGLEVRQWKQVEVRQGTTPLSPGMLCGKLTWRGRVHKGGAPARPTRHIHAAESRTRDGQGKGKTENRMVFPPGRAVAMEPHGCGPSGPAAGT